MLKMVKKEMILQFIRILVCSNETEMIVFHLPDYKLFHSRLAVATTETDEAIASSDFLKIIGISPIKGANRGDSCQF